MKMMDRDIEIVKFLKEVGVADTRTISTLFFNGGIRRCNQRLNTLKDNKKLKVFRENILSQNIYYIGRKPSNWKHKIVFSQLLAELKTKEIEILKYRCPLKCGNVIADGFIAIRVDNINKIYFVEVERTKKLDIDKYIELYYSRKWKELFPIMPSILCITDSKVKNNSRLDIKSCKLNLEDLII